MEGSRRSSRSIRPRCGSCYLAAPARRPGDAGEPALSLRLQPVAADSGRWAFRSRDFRLFMVGNLISWIGDWMDLAALNWAVLALTGSAIDLGLINACRLIPVFALSLPAGVLADRSIAVGC